MKKKMKEEDGYERRREDKEQGRASVIVGGNESDAFLFPENDI